MLELIGSIVLIYYLVVGVAALIFLAWGYLDDRRQSKRRRHETGAWDDAEVRPGNEVEHDTTRQAKATEPRPDNVVRFKRNK